MNFINNSLVKSAVLLVAEKLVYALFRVKNEKQFESKRFQRFETGWWYCIKSDSTHFTWNHG